MSARAEPSAARTLARLYCPPAQRSVLDTLLGIEAEIGAALRRGLEHDVAHARLSWWREECERLARGQPLHPLTRALAEHLGPQGRTALAGAPGLVELAAWDLAAAPFASAGERRDYVRRWSAGFVAPLARVAFAAPAPEPALVLGARLRELELLNSLSPDATRGRLRVPLDALEAAGASPAQLSAARWDAPLANLIRCQHQEARGQLAAAVAALRPHEQAPLQALLVWAALLQAHSRRLTAALPQAGRAGDHAALLDGWRAWRAARQASAGRLKLHSD
jgi:phytoene synthase